MSGAETLARALRNAAGRSRAFCKHRPRKTELDALPGRSEVKRREVPKAFLADPRVSHFSVVQNASATSQGRDFARLGSTIVPLCHVHELVAGTKLLGTVVSSPHLSWKGCWAFIL